VTADPGLAGRPLDVAVIPGDGTGPEVVAEAVGALDAAAGRFGFEIAYRHYDLGGERYLRTGETLPPAVLEELRTADAILLGAIGHPDVAPGILEQEILLTLRRELDQYVNLRPVRLYPGVATPVRGIEPDDVDMVVVRENTEGLYTGTGGFTRRYTADEIALQTSVNTRFAVERCIRYAFGLARSRPAGAVTLCGKTNVLTYAHDLWQRVFDEVAALFPEIPTGYAHVDALCLLMIEDPGRYDVIVTDNMFGDIITDLGAVLQGGLGIAAGGNLNPEGVSMFEPIGGTAPAFTGTGEINPLAAIGAAALLLMHTGHEAAGRAIETAVAEVAGSLPSLRAGEMGATTAQVGERVANHVAEASAVSPTGKER
jgi:3-isopropylmalate dehydrogenase